MKSRLKQLGKDSIIYGLGGIFAQGIGLFFLPIYTRIFPPADYGTIDMLLAISSFVGVLLLMGMDAAQNFYFFEQREGGKPAQARVVTAIVQWRLAWGMVIVGAGMVLSPLLNAEFFDGQLTWEYFAVAFVGSLFTQLMRQSAAVFRLLYRPWSYIGITLSNALASAVIAIALVVWLDWGALGYFIGFSMGSMVTALIGWWGIRAYLDWSAWHRDWWPRLVRFGAPLLPATLAIYVLSTADRWFISYYHGQDALGMYAVGAKFSFFITLAVTTYRRAWGPIAMDAMHSTDGPQLFRTMGQLYLGLGSVGIVLLTALSPLLVRLFTAPAYHAAYPIAGVLAWPSVLYGFYLIGAGGIWKKEKTFWAPIFVGVAALLHIILIIWLVPQFGSMGAAVAMSISFFVWNAMALCISEKLWPVHYPLDILGLQIGIGVAAMTTILVLYSRNQEPWKVAVVTAIAAIILIGLTVKLAYIKWFFREVKYRVSIIGANR